MKRITFNLTERQARVVMDEMTRPANYSEEAAYRRQCRQIVNKIEAALGYRKSKPLIPLSWVKRLKVMR